MFIQLLKIDRPLWQFDLFENFFPFYYLVLLCFRETFFKHFVKRFLSLLYLELLFCELELLFLFFLPFPRKLHPFLDDRSSRLGRLHPSLFFIGNLLNFIVEFKFFKLFRFFSFDSQSLHSQSIIPLQSGEDSFWISNLCDWRYTWLWHRLMKALWCWWKL